MDGELHHAMHPGSLPVLALRPEATWRRLGAGALDELPCMTSWKLGRCAKAEVSTGKVQIPPTPEFWQPQYRLEHYSPLPSVNKVLRNTPRTQSGTQHSLAKRLGPPSTPSLPKPASASNHPTAGPLPCAALASPFAHLGIPSFLVPRSSRRRPRPRPRRRTTRSQAPGPIPSPFRCKSAAMATLGDDLLGTVNKLQDLVFNTIGNDSLDLPQIVRGHVPRCATLPGHGMLTIPLLC